jgi:hypothetical protein
VARPERDALAPLSGEEPVAVVLDLVQPVGAGGWLGDKERLTWGNEAGRPGAPGTRRGDTPQHPATCRGPRAAGEGTAPCWVDASTAAVNAATGPVGKALATEVGRKKQKIGSRGQAAARDIAYLIWLVPKGNERQMEKLLFIAAAIVALTSVARAESCLPEFTPPKGDEYAAMISTLNIYCRRVDHICKTTHNRNACATRAMLAHDLNHQAE